MYTSVATVEVVISYYVMKVLCKFLLGVFYIRWMLRRIILRETDSL